MPRATTATTRAPRKAREPREPREVVHIDPQARQSKPIVFNDTPETTARVEALIDPTIPRRKSDVLRMIMDAGLPIVEEALKAPKKRAARKVAAR